MVFFSIGDDVEIAGKKEEQMDASWWRCRVLDVHHGGAFYTVEWLDIVSDVDENQFDVTHNVPRSRLRAPPPDDSATICPQDREINAPVDVWYKDGWWEGLVSNLYDESCTVYFPSTDEYYTNISVNDAEGRLLRSGFAWREDIWSNVPRRRRTMFDVAANDHRTKRRREGKGRGVNRPAPVPVSPKKRAPSVKAPEGPAVPEGLPADRKHATLGMLIEWGLLAPGDVVFVPGAEEAALGWIETDGSISVGGAAPFRTDATFLAPKQYKDHVAPGFMAAHPAWRCVAVRVGADGVCRRLMRLRNAMYEGEALHDMVRRRNIGKIAPPSEAQLQELERQRSGGGGGGGGGDAAATTSQSEYESAPEGSQLEDEHESQEPVQPQSQSESESQPPAKAAPCDDDSDLAPEIFDTSSSSDTSSPEPSSSGEEGRLGVTGPGAPGFTSRPAPAPASGSEDKPLISRAKRLSMSPLVSPAAKKARGLAPAATATTTAARPQTQPPPATQAVESSPSAISLVEGRKANAQVAGLLNDFADSDDGVQAGPSLSPVKLTPTKTPDDNGAAATPGSVKERLREEDGPRVRKQSFKTVKSPAKVASAAATPKPAVASPPATKPAAAAPPQRTVEALAALKPAAASKPAPVPAFAAGPRLKSAAAPQPTAAHKPVVALAASKPAASKPTAQVKKPTAGLTAAVALKKAETKKKAAPAAPAAPPKPFIIPKRAAAGGTAAPTTRAAPSEAPGPSKRRALASATVPQPAKDTVWCLDNLPQWVSRQALKAALVKAGVTGLARVDVPCVPLDVGESHSGYAVLTFARSQDAAAAEPTLRSLCVKTATCPVSRPLLLRRPWLTAGYPWGASQQLPGHLPLATVTVTPHFAQPGSLEFEMALSWRVLDRTVSIARNALHVEHARELAGVLRAYVEEVGGTAAMTTAAAEAAVAVPPPPPASQPSALLWVRGVGPQVTERALTDAFSQFGFPQMVAVPVDAVTRKSRGVAVVRMESAERAAAVADNMREMVFLLGGSPRPLSVAVAVPGGPRGSQSVYDRALRAVFGRHDDTVADLELVAVAEDPGEGAAPEVRAAAVCRALLQVQAEEAGAAREAARVERAALAEDQKQQYRRENEKLLRLKALHDNSAFRSASVLHQVPLKKYTRGGAGALVG